MDLFAFLPESTKSAPPPPPAPAPAPIAAPPAPAVAPPPPRAPIAQTVASFACYCGCQDEVLEPAPETVDCWGCKKPLAMHRWHPNYLVPSRNARQLTEAERARI